LNVLKKDGTVNIFVKSEILLPQCSTVCILLLIRSKTCLMMTPWGQNVDEYFTKLDSVVICLFFTVHIL